MNQKTSIRFFCKYPGACRLERGELQMVVLRHGYCRGIDKKHESARVLGYRQKEKSSVDYNLQTTEIKGERREMNIALGIYLVDLIRLPDSADTFPS